MTSGFLGIAGAQVAPLDIARTIIGEKEKLSERENQSKQKEKESQEEGQNEGGKTDEKTARSPQKQKQKQQQLQQRKQRQQLQFEVESAVENSPNSKRRGGILKDSATASSPSAASSPSPLPKSVSKIRLGFGYNQRRRSLVHFSIDLKNRVEERENRPSPSSNDCSTRSESDGTAANNWSDHPSPLSSLSADQEPAKVADYVAVTQRSVNVRNVFKEVLLDVGGKEKREHTTADPRVGKGRERHIDRQRQREK